MRPHDAVDRARMRLAWAASVAVVGACVGAVAGVHAMTAVCRNGCAGEAVLLLSGWPVHLAAILATGAAMWGWHRTAAAGAVASGALAWAAVAAVWSNATWGLYWPVAAPALEVAAGFGLLAYWLAATLLGIAALMGTHAAAQRLLQPVA